MSIITSTIVYGIVAYLIDALAWGTVGYMFFRLIGIKEKYFVYDCLLVIIIYTFWEYWTLTFIEKLDITSGNEELLAFIGDDISYLFKMEFSDVVIGVLLIFGGYMLGMYMLRNFKSRLAGT